MSTALVCGSRGLAAAWGFSVCYHHSAWMSQQERGDIPVGVLVEVLHV